MAPTISFEYLSRTVGQDYVVQIPLFLVLVAGMIISLIRYRRYPKVSTFMFISFAILTVVHLIFPIVSWSIALTPSHQQAMTALTIVEVTASVLRALAYILLIVAIFGWRREKAAAAP